MVCGEQVALPACSSSLFSVLGSLPACGLYVLVWFWFVLMLHYRIVAVSLMEIDEEELVASKKRMKDCFGNYILESQF